MDLKPETILAGQELPVIHRHPTRHDLIKYAAVSEDYAKTHWDTEYMQGLGFPSVIVHGWLTCTYMLQVGTEFIPAERGTVIAYHARHKRPTFAGPVTCGGHVESTEEQDGKTILNLALWVKAEDGGVNTTGTMKIRLDD